MVTADESEFALGSLTGSSYSTTMEHDKVEDDEGWVVVKKQRIIILIPPPSPPHQQTDNPEVNHTKRKPQKSVRRRLVTTKKRQNRSEERNHKSAATVHENKIQTEDFLEKPSNPSDIGNQVDIEGLNGLRPLDHLVSLCKDGTKNHKQVNVSRNLLLQHAPVSNLLAEREIVVHSRQAISSLRAIADNIKLPIGMSNVVNRKMRALYFERRLQMFGGLRSWLLSLGLSQLIKILEREKLGIFQLVDLTMNKLKEMGVNAVGPRRKLINAIDTLCQPYYLKALQ